MTSRRFGIICAASIAMLAPASAFLPVPVGAEPLDKESCAKLEVERRQLLTREMRDALDRGPDWVKRNLSPEKIERVRHFLGVEEQLVFRCRKDGFPPGVGNFVMEFPDRNPTRLKAQKSGTKPSQALADSDKTRPDRARAATR